MLANGRNGADVETPLCNFALGLYTAH
jgi:hypothetical protein